MSDEATRRLADFPLFRYRATCVSVTDGDTIVLAVDLGLYVTRRITVRLLGIDAPERRGPERARGVAATQAMRELVEGRAVYVETRKDDRSFDRWLANVFVPGLDGGLHDVGRLLAALGHATEDDR